MFTTKNLIARIVSLIWIASYCGNAFASSYERLPENTIIVFKDSATKTSLRSIMMEVVEPGIYQFKYCYMGSKFKEAIIEGHLPYKKVVCDNIDTPISQSEIMDINVILKEDLIKFNKEYKIASQEKLDLSSRNGLITVGAMIVSCLLTKTCRGWTKERLENAASLVMGRESTGVISHTRQIFIDMPIETAVIPLTAGTFGFVLGLGITSEFIDDPKLSLERQYTDATGLTKVSNEKDLAYLNAIENQLESYNEGHDTNERVLYMETVESVTAMSQFLSEIFVLRNSLTQNHR